MFGTEGSSARRLLLPLVGAEMVGGRSRWGASAARLWLVGVLAALIAATRMVWASAAPASAHHKGSMIDLGTLGGTNSSGVAINAWGQVAGTADTPGMTGRGICPSGFRWTSSGGMQVVGGCFDAPTGESFATGINGHGTVIGFFQIEEASDAFVWTPAGGLQNLADPRLGAFFLEQPLAINARGQITGYVLPTGSRMTRAFLWTASTGIKDLGTLGGDTARGVAINDRGEVTGFSCPAASVHFTCNVHAFLWTKSGGMRDLGTLGGPNSTATAINARGEVIGYSDMASGATHAFLWRPHGGMQDLGTLGGTNSTATAINERGQITGSADTTSGATHAFLWPAHRGMRDLGTLGGTNSTATAINERGQVTGSADTTSGATHAFLWPAYSGMIDLGTLGGTSSSGAAINARGQITGSADTTGDASHHAFLWNP